MLVIKLIIQFFYLIIIQLKKDALVIISGDFNTKKDVLNVGNRIKNIPLNTKFKQ